MKPGNFKNVIFDLGGVIIDLDFQAGYREFNALTGLPVEEIISRTEGMMFFKEYEQGLIDSAAFRDQVKQLLEFTATDKAIDKAWCSMLGGIPAYRLELLKRLKRQFRTFALSNTNEIHVRKFNSIVRKSLGSVELLHDHFEKVYYSYQMKMRKPDVEIYQTVMNEQGLKPHETLFIDDNADNIRGAEFLGIRTMHIQDPKQLVAVFNGVQ